MPLSPSQVLGTASIPVAGEPRRGRRMDVNPMNGTTDLRYEVFVSDMVPVAAPPWPDDGPTLWSPLSHTLIYGKNEALLTDPPVIREQADALITWVESHDVAL